MEAPISADRKSKKNTFVDRRQSSFAFPAHTTLGDGSSACWFTPPSLSLLGGVEKIDEQQLTPQEQTLRKGQRSQRGGMEIYISEAIAGVSALVHRFVVHDRHALAASCDSSSVNRAVDGREEIRESVLRTEKNCPSYV